MELIILSGDHSKTNGGLSPEKCELPGLNVSAEIRLSGYRVNRDLFERRKKLTKHNC